jgi:hypothetical protein
VAIVGIVFLVLIALAVLFGVVVMLVSMRDINRYRRLRRM